MTAQDALTFHRPPREYPPAVPSERLRIAPSPVQPPSPHTSIIQLLFPVVGGVSMVGFALVYGNTLFLYIAGAMILLLLLLFSLGMRWPQKPSVRNRAAEGARSRLDRLIIVAAVSQQDGSSVVEPEVLARGVPFLDEDQNA